MFKIAPLPGSALHFASLAVICFFSVAVRGHTAKRAAVPTVVEAVAPAYPGIALAMPKGGDVTVEVIIGRGGVVEEAKVLTGAGPLRHPAVIAARLWRFSPEDAGQRVTLTFLFRVMPKDTPPEDLTTVFKPPYGVKVQRTMPGPVVNYGQ